MKALERYFFAGVDPVRPWLLLRSLLLLLAFDCWLDLVPHGVEDASVADPPALELLRHHPVSGGLDILESSIGATARHGEPPEHEPHHAPAKGGDPRS